MEQLWEPDTLSSSVSYSQLIPVLVKSNQELHERIVHLERALEIQQQHDAQIADLEAAVASRDQQIDELVESSVTSSRDWRRWKLKLLHFSFVMSLLCVSQITHFYFFVKCFIGKHLVLERLS